jgi:hypothetical protein
MLRSVSNHVLIMTTKVDTLDQELAAVKTVYGALAPLEDKGRQFVLKTVTDRLGAPTPSNREASGSTRVEPQDPPAARPNPPAASLRSAETLIEFLRQKRPLTEVQRIACLAYYLTHNKRQPQFKTKDLTKLNTDAKQTGMSNPSMTVMNATRQNNFLSQLAHGMKQITTFGEDVVAALPDQAAVKALMKGRRKPRKRNAKKAGAKTN